MVVAHPAALLLRYVVSIAAMANATPNVIATLTDTVASAVRPSMVSI